MEKNAYVNDFFDNFKKSYTQVSNRLPSLRAVSSPIDTVVLLT